MADQNNPVTGVAELIGRLRAGGGLPDDEAQCLFRTEAVHTFREHLSIEDLDWLIPLLRRTSGWSYAFLAPQLTMFRLEPGLGELTRAFWLSEWERRREFLERDSVLWRLADYEDLTLRLKCELYGFVREHWSSFLQTELFYMSVLGGGDMVEAARQRLKDRRYPPSKDWLYLCAAFGSGAPERVRGLLEEYSGAEDGFVREVSRDLLRDFQELMEAVPDSTPR